MEWKWSKWSELAKTRLYYQKKLGISLFINQQIGEINIIRRNIKLKKLINK